MMVRRSEFQATYGIINTGSVAIRTVLPLLVSIYTFFFILGTSGTSTSSIRQFASDDNVLKIRALLSDVRLLTSIHPA